MDAARAIADPVRREILLMLRESPRTAGHIAAAFDISRPAVSRHLRVLRDCGLLHPEPSGREIHYTLDTAPLTEIAQWLAQFTTPAAQGAPTVRSQGTAPAEAELAAPLVTAHHLDALATEVHRARRAHRHPAEDTHKETA